MRIAMPHTTWIQKRDASARASVAAASRAVGGRAGIIKDVLNLMIEPDDPRLFHAVTDVTDTAWLYGRGGRGENGATGNGGGAGLTSELAIASAIGETIERTCSSIYDQRSLVVSSYADLQRVGKRAVSPYSFALFSDRQYSRPDFAYHRFSEDLVVSWAYGYSLAKEEPILVPACLVYLPYKYEHHDDLIADGVSTGLCCARSVPEAILGGLYEVIERDAIMIMWMNKLPCPRLNPSSDLWLSTLLQERFGPSGLILSINDISTDIPIPVVFGLLVDEQNEGIAVTVGAAANLNAEEAALKALVEAAQGRLWIKHIERRRGIRKYREDFSDVESFEDHVRLFGSLDKIPYVDFLLRSPVERDILSVQTLGAMEPAQDLRKCVDTLAAKGLDVIAVNLTQPDVEELGFHVVKVLVPGLVDINAHHSYPLLGAMRLYSVPRLLGYKDRDTREDEMNPHPHPFP